jgi:hypothetical protein
MAPTQLTCRIRVDRAEEPHQAAYMSLIAIKKSEEPRYSHWCHSVQNHLINLWMPLFQGLLSSSESHRQNLGRGKEQWQLFKTNVVCLSCLLRRKPEHHLGCGHSICDTCVEIFGEGMVGFRDQYLMKGCVVCHLEGGIIVRLKPRTAGARIISIDGGGPRGVVPLKTLSLLQDLAGKDCPIRDLFDIAVGTSAGKILWTFVTSHRNRLSCNRRPHRVECLYPTVADRALH